MRAIVADVFNFASPSADRSQALMNVFERSRQSMETVLRISGRGHITKYLAESLQMTLVIAKSQGCSVHENTAAIFGTIQRGNHPTRVRPAAIFGGAIQTEAGFALQLFSGRHKQVHRLADKLVGRITELALHSRVPCEEESVRAHEHIRNAGS